MKTTMRVTWTLVYLGLLLHCVYAEDPTDDPNPGALPPDATQPTALATPTTVLPTTATVPPTTATVPPTTATVPPTTTVLPPTITTAPLTTMVLPITTMTQPITTTVLPTTPTTVPPIITTVLPINNPAPPTTTTVPAIIITVPAIITTVPLITTTVLPATPTMVPPIDTTVPPINKLAPPIATTVPPITTTVPPITTTVLPPTSAASKAPIIVQASSVSAPPAMTGKTGAPDKSSVTATPTAPSPSTQQSNGGATGADVPSNLTEAGVTSINIITTITTIMTEATATEAPPRTFSFRFPEGDESKGDKELAAVCRRLTVDMLNASCFLSGRQHGSNGKREFHTVTLGGNVSPKLASQYYEEITKEKTDNTTLIAILASCGALLAMIIGLAIYASHHRKPYNENQQHLTEELHTVENGYHDNPTLEVMEVQPPEMQEKKVALNGEFNDSWIVPFDSVVKEDIPDEEDTHL